MRLVSGDPVSTRMSHMERGALALPADRPVPVDPHAVSPLGLCRKDIFRTGGKDKCVRGVFIPF